MKVKVSRDPDGVWKCRPYLGTDKMTRKRIRPSKRFPEAKTEEEAQALAEAWAASLAQFALHATLPYVPEVLYRYIAFRDAEGTPYNTVRTYTSLVRCHIEPRMAHVHPDDVKPYMISALYEELLICGGRNGSGISPNTVIQMHWFLRKAWRWMVAERLSSFNPMLSVEHPKAIKVKARAYTGREFSVLANWLNEAIKAPGMSRSEVLMRNVAFAASLALWNAERVGEVCANIRTDAELFREVMRVSYTAVEKPGGVVRQPRTKGGKVRNVAMDTGVCDDIRAHWEWQEGYLPTETKAHPRDSLTICTTYQGTIMRPSMVSHEFSKIRDELGLPEDTSFHTLRHTHATWMLLNGGTLADVMERLGHESSSTTLDNYAHMLPGRDREAVRAFRAAADRVMERDWYS